MDVAVRRQNRPTLTEEEKTSREGTARENKEERRLRVTEIWTWGGPQESAEDGGSQANWEFLRGRARMHQLE